jgi:hypothetical protein
MRGIVSRMNAHTWQAVAIEAEIRKSGIALSEQEYTMLVTAMTGCARNSSLRS